MAWSADDVGAALRVLEEMPDALVGEHLGEVGDLFVKLKERAERMDHAQDQRPFRAGGAATGVGAVRSLERACRSASAS